MPNRIIKESICTSEEIDALTDSQEILFYRLLVNADDYGLLDARPSILKSKCYPLKSIDIECMKADINALIEIGLICMYEVADKQYLSIKKWAEHQQIRAKRAKFPMPSEGHDINGYQMQSNAPVIQSNPIQNPIQSNLAATSQSAPTKKESDPRNRQAWKAYSDAYFDRYQTEPVANAKVNGMVANLVKRLGDEAAPVAAFYLSHNQAWYVSKAHAFEYLLKDAESLRTQWATNRTVTSRDARQIEKRAGIGMGDLLDNALGDMEAKF